MCYVLSAVSTFGSGVKSTGMGGGGEEGERMSGVSSPSDGSWVRSEWPAVERGVRAAAAATPSKQLESLLGGYAGTTEQKFGLGEGDLDELCGGAVGASGSKACRNPRSGCTKKHQPRELGEGLGGTAWFVVMDAAGHKAYAGDQALVLLKEDVAPAYYGHVNSLKNQKLPLKALAVHRSV